jgi:hypothetical protein
MELNDSSDLPFMIFSKKYHPAKVLILFICSQMAILLMLDAEKKLMVHTCTCKQNC